MSTAINLLLADAHAKLDGGFSVLPAGTDKQPAAPTWKRYQAERPTTEEINGWFAKSPWGLGIVCGEVSGRLTVIDLDAKNDPTGTLNARVEAAIRGAMPGVYERLTIESTPSGGRHLYFCAPEAHGNLKLALPAQGTKAIIETRGEGGFIVAAPTPGYVLLQGTFDGTPVLSTDEHESLLDLMRSLDERPRKEAPTPVAREHGHRHGLSPFDDFNARGNPLEILHRHGWAEVGSAQADGTIKLRRPGKCTGISATWNHAGRRTLCVFSSSTQFETAPTTYSAAGVYAMLEHGGDFNAAARELLRLGFGERTAEPRETAASVAADEAPTQPTARALLDIRVDAQARHESNLLGNGFLRRGGGLLFVGPTGVGKSTTIIQGAMKWALGQDMFGISAAKPLTFLYVQAENDDEDLEEISQGVIKGLALAPADVDIIRRRFFVVTTHERGGFLFSAIKMTVETLKPDVLIIDPVLAYLAGEMNAQADVTTFLRAQLHPFLRKHGMGAILVHHTPKPNRQQKGTAPAKGSDLAYAGAGSSEFANWARAVMTLQPLGKDAFDLVIGKRWKRAGLKGAGGFLTDTVRIAHASEPGAIYWKLADKPEDGDENRLDLKKVSDLFRVFNKARKSADGTVALKLLAERLGNTERTVRRWFLGSNDRIELNGEALRRLPDGRIEIVDSDEAAA